MATLIPTSSPPAAEAHARVQSSPAPTASTSSLRSQDSTRPNDATSPPPSILSGTTVHSNGNGTPPERPAGPSRKPTFTARLSRMFSQKDANEVTRDASRRDYSARINGSALEESDESTPRPRPVAPSRAPTNSDSMGALSRNTSDPRRDETVALPKRFWVDEEGEHHHYLKNAKRQEKLSQMLKDFMLGKKKEHHHQDEQPALSLMSNWADQIKNEKDKLAKEKKDGPNATASLVQKYGKCQEVVGRGAFGIVRIAHKTDPENSKQEQLYAVKEFRRRPQEDAKKYNKRLNAEFCISSSLRHPNVIHTLDLLEDGKGDFCEVMEFCPGGDLYSLVLANGKLEVTEADCYFAQLMRGVEYMHEMGVAHRDLKPENLLLTTHGALKIADFGNGECFRMAWETEPHLVNGLCGSGPYIAPEVYTDTEFDPRAVDVWACGVIYMAMRTNRHLWHVARKGEDEFYDSYVRGRKSDEGYGPIETLHRARCRNVIYSILDPNAGRRISAHQVLNSEWGKGIKLCKAGEEGL